MRKWISILSLFTCISLRAQVATTDSLIQFSGLVMTSDSLMAVPYAGIWSLTRNNGTTCDYNG
ncbi:MAG TPA: hypothetical protein PKO19_02155, partial [Chitinophagales bacterium]|nr:hypothetical protein [Chitinophagales bacterium]